MRARPARTCFTVRREADGAIETIAGSRNAWSFRLHFHAGDEVVRMLAGRARLRLPDGCREVGAGDTLVVPAGVVHHFEPVDAEGWAFDSRFLPAPACRNAPCEGESAVAAWTVARLASRPSLRSDVAALALDADISCDYLTRLFRRTTGCGPHNYHVLLAVRHAKALLRRQIAVVDAALAAGFCDQPHLNREFVRTYGMTPAAFRAGWAVVA